MKTKLLLNPGTGWSGTTPFYYTLRDCNYCFAGYKKEFHYLQMMYSDKKEFTDWMIKRYCNNTTNDYRTGKPQVKTREWDEDYYRELLTPPHTFGKYIGHMQRMDSIYTEYHAVCDFSNHNIGLPEKFLTAHGNAIKDIFDVRVTMIVADPVFRYYQEIGGTISQYHAGEHKRKKMGMLWKNEDMIVDHYIRNKKQQKLFKYLVERLRFSNNCNYESNYDKLCRSYGKKNVLLIRMERFWDSSYYNEEIDRLSEFLDYQVSGLYPNVYCGGEGEGLNDQNTEFEPLTDELYNWAKDKL